MSIRIFKNWILIGLIGVSFSTAVFAEGPDPADQEGSFKIDDFGSKSALEIEKELEPLFQNVMIFNAVEELPNDMKYEIYRRLILVYGVEGYIPRGVIALPDIGPAKILEFQEKPYAIFDVYMEGGKAVAKSFTFANQYCMKRGLTLPSAVINNNLVKVIREQASYQERLAKNQIIDPYFWTSNGQRGKVAYFTFVPNRAMATATVETPLSFFCVKAL